MEVCQILNIMTQSLSDKYLGLPFMIGMDRTDCFKHLIERIAKLVNGWKERLLSLGGKESLLKAVAQSIPTYAMSVFKFSKQICKGITDAMSHYLWVMRKTKGECIGLHGGRCVCQRDKEEWGFEIFIVLI